jgi:ankyrin repeat protein
MGADEAIYYLLAWTENVDHQDKYGATPLHLAVENSHRY